MSLARPQISIRSIIHARLQLVDPVEVEAQGQYTPVLQIIHNTLPLIQQLIGEDQVIFTRIHREPLEWQFPGKAVTQAVWFWASG